MAMWRCPHCATPQAETARCWVCKRSSTTCATCLNYRRSVAPGIGYCGLDRKRGPLDGREIRPCWEGGTARVPVAAGAAATAGVVGTATVGAAMARGPAGEGRPRLDFVPIGTAEREPLTTTDRPHIGPTVVPATDPDRTGLWDDTDLGGATATRPGR